MPVLPEPGPKAVDAVLAGAGLFGSVCTLGLSADVVLRVPGALVRWVSTATIVVNHVQSLTAIAGLRRDPKHLRLFDRRQRGGWRLQPPH